MFIVGAIILGGLFVTHVAAGSAPPTVKIGLVAPFEGEYRSTGYDVLFAVKLALQERNQGEGLHGYRVQLVALNDFNNPVVATEQARALVADPGLVGVIGHLHPAATGAALPVYRAADLAVVAPWSVDEVEFQMGGLVSVAASTGRATAYLQQFINNAGLTEITEISDVEALNDITPDTEAIILNVDAVPAGAILQALPSSAIEQPIFGHTEVGNRQLPQVAGPAADGLIFVSPGPAAGNLVAGDGFVTNYQAIAGVPPGPRAVLAYDATHHLLDSIAKTIQINRKWYNKFPDRAMVSRTLTQVERTGISGQIRFGDQGRRLDAPLWIYQISQSDYPGTLLAP